VFQINTREKYNIFTLNNVKGTTFDSLDLGYTCILIPLVFTTLFIKQQGNKMSFKEDATS
jgi:hypothetical protein